MTMKSNGRDRGDQLTVEPPRRRLAPAAAQPTTRAARRNGRSLREAMAEARAPEQQETARDERRGGRFPADLEQRNRQQSNERGDQTRKGAFRRA
jgi:hypothetical protein